MAIVTVPLGHPQVSGGIGQTIVFRRTANGQIAQSYPTIAPERTPARCIQQTSFRQAVLDADTQLQDPAVKAYWQAYTLAHALKMDYRNALISHLMGGL
jgi:hypothetical protein